MQRIYSDLDHTLIAPIVQGDVVVDVKVRPGVDWFLNTLAEHHELWLLTFATREHAEASLRVIGPAAANFAGIISREDLAPVAQAIAVGSRCVPQIAPPGFMFDDFAAGPDDLDLYETKSAAIGISEDAWIKVEEYNADQRDRKGLLKAYQEYLRRVA